MLDPLDNFKPILTVTADGEVSGNYWENLHNASIRLEQERALRKELEPEEPKVKPMPKKRRSKTYIPLNRKKKKKRTIEQAIKEETPNVVRMFMDLRMAPSNIGQKTRLGTQIVYEILLSQGIDYKLEMVARRDNICFSENYTPLKKIDWETAIPDMEKRLARGDTLASISKVYKVPREVIALQVLRARKERLKCVQ